MILALGAAIAGMMIVFTKQTSKQIWSGRAAILTLIAGLLGLLVFWAQTNKEIAAATPRSSFIPAEKLPPSGEQQGLIVVVTSSGETSDFSSKLMDVLSSRYKFITINNGISVGFPCDLVIFSNGQNASRLQNDLEKLNLKAIISDGFPPIPARIYADYRDYMVLVVPERR